MQGSTSAEECLTRHRAARTRAMFGEKTNNGLTRAQRRVRAAAPAHVNAPTSTPPRELAYVNALARIAYECAVQAVRAAAALAPAGRRQVAPEPARAPRNSRSISRMGRAHARPRAPAALDARPVGRRRIAGAPGARALRARAARDSSSPTRTSRRAPSAFARALDVDFRDYLPFDTAGDARAALDALRPTALVFSKLDVWPVLTREARARGVRLGLDQRARCRRGSSRRSRVGAALLRDAYARARRRRRDRRRRRRPPRRARRAPRRDLRHRRHALRPGVARARSASTAPVRCSRRSAARARRSSPARRGPPTRRAARRRGVAARATVPDARLIIAPHEPTPIAPRADRAMGARDAGSLGARSATPSRGATPTSSRRSRRRARRSLRARRRRVRRRRIPRRRPALGARAGGVRRARAVRSRHEMSRDAALLVARGGGGVSRGGLTPDSCAVGFDLWLEADCGTARDGAATRARDVVRRRDSARPSDRSSSSIVCCADASARAAPPAAYASRRGGDGGRCDGRCRKNPCTRCTPSSCTALNSSARSTPSAIDHRAVIVREPHHRLHEILLDEIRVDRVDQRDVELDEVRLEVGDRSQAGVAAAGVVDGEAKAALAKRAAAARGTWDSP